MHTSQSYKVWLTQELEEKIADADKTAMLIEQLKSVFDKFRSDFGIFPSSGDYLELDDKKTYTVNGRVLIARQGKHELHITVDEAVVPKDENGEYTSMIG